MLEIIPYSDENKHYIKELNFEWLNKYFSVEPNDVVQLSNPKAEIIDKDGFIFYARFDNEIVGTAALMKIDETTVELCKMAVTESMQGKGIGRALMEHCLETASKNKIRKLILYSSTRLETAIAMYFRYGFVEVPFDSTHYKRANIKMELIIW